MATTSLEITWFYFLLTDLQVSHPYAVVLHYNNKVALHIASNLVFHEKTKHIELDCHLNPNKIQKGILKITHISTKSQLANVFTKGLFAYLLSSHMSKIGIVN
jgi:hypothetical protein